MNQTKEIIKYLKTGKTLTAIEALQKFGCFRLAARIGEITSINVESKLIFENGKRFAEYRMVA